MKVTTFLSFIGLLATSAIASPASAEVAPDTALAAECGSLGVMKVDMSDLPEDVNPSAIRRCAEHPLGRYPGLAPEDMSDAVNAKLFARDDVENDLVNLKPRACQSGDKDAGCSGGYCWKLCGLAAAGEWCWTAKLGGLGAWNTCNTDKECTAVQSCGVGTCSTCGCGC